MRYLPLVLLLIVFAVAAALKRRLGTARPQTAALPYSRRDTLVTPAERAFLGVLDLAVGEGRRVFAKVRLCDVIEPRPKLPPGPRQSALNRIQSKHLDFVVCQRDTLAILCAVELNGSTHRSTKRSQRDEFLAKALAEAGVALVSFTARKSYPVQEVSGKLAQALNGTSSRPHEADTAAQ